MVSDGLTTLQSQYSIDSIESAAKARTVSFTRYSSTPTMVPTLSLIAENPQSRSSPPATRPSL